MAKRLPIEAPWTARRAEESDSRSVAWFLERSGIRTTIARDLFDSVVRGLFCGDLNQVSFLNMLFLIRASGGFNSLVSITGGYQENLVGGGAGSIARHVADGIGAAVHLNTPGRAIGQRQDHVVVQSAALTVSARHVVVAVPPALALDIAFDPVLPQDRLTLYRHSTAGPETKTLLVYDEPFWHANAFSGQSAGPKSASEVTLRSPHSVSPDGVAPVVIHVDVVLREHRLASVAADRHGGLSLRPRHGAHQSWG